MAYADGAFTDRAYKVRLADLDTQLKEASAVVPPSFEDAAELFQNIEILWKEATLKERRKLISPLVERVYVDMDLKLIGAITPTPAFGGLIQCAIKKSRSAVYILTDEDEERLQVWSWWRRGRIELPVQRKNVKDLLQACLGF